MALALYLDDCAYSRSLAERLRQAGHRVVVPADVGTTGQHDRVHFDLARREGLIVVTKNPSDFLAFHEADPNHPGIIAIYQDNDPRDMSHGEILLALEYLESILGESGGIANQFHNLNQWRR